MQFGKLFYFALCISLICVSHSDARDPRYFHQIVIEQNVNEFKKTRVCRLMDLSGADLTQVNFIGATLDSCILRDVNLSNVTIRYTKIRRCMLDRANLDGAVIEDSDLYDSILTGAIPPKAIRNTQTYRTLWVNNCRCNDLDCSNCTGH